MVPRNVSYEPGAAIMEYVHDDFATTLLGHSLPLGGIAFLPAHVHFRKEKTSRRKAGVI